MVGVYFANQNGKVTATTGLWGGEDLRVIASFGQVLEPAHVRLTIEFVVERPSNDSDLWKIQDLDLILTKNRIVQCTETIRYLRTAGADPYKIAIYRGNLRLITEAETAAVTEELKRRGLQVRGRVRAGSEGQ